ncbi:hypothetical protein ABFV47_07640 [Mycolicibacterium fortuitum]|uniref:hypothetical protein n=1 Tax=Mycolicibacterium fortuitum TaxID=1766 RepID=UPI001CDC061C|nr:hypothetical protein [Mycolicibacterium fortuitum]UBV22727.1 hypothetical protein H8Z59_06045 [Mycolicibacterium fortuitum]
MSGSGSVLTRALELQAKARRQGDTAKDRDEAARVAAEVENAENQLAVLEGLLDLVAELRALEVEVDTGDLASGLKNFEKYAGGGGLPSPQAVLAATRKIAEVQKRVREALGTAWQGWTGQVIRQLPTENISLIAQGKAGSVSRAVDAMRMASRQIPADSSTIALFVRNRDIVQRELSDVESLHPHLTVVLKQLQGGGTTLDQLTDDDIVVLREHGWAANILVKRADVD